MAEEAKKKAMAIVNMMLKPAFKDGSLSKDNFKAINERVCRAVAAEYRGEPIDAAFEQGVRDRVEAKKQEVLANGNGQPQPVPANNGGGGAGLAVANGNGNGHALPPPPTNGGHTGNGHGGGLPPMPAHLQEPAPSVQPAAPQPVAPQPAGAPAPMDVDLDQDRKRPRDEAEGGSDDRPAPPPPQPQQNNLQPLQVNLSDVRGGLDGSAPEDKPVMPMADKRAPGTLGRPLREVYANCCVIDVPKQLLIHQFDVSYSWIEGKGVAPISDGVVQDTIELFGTIFGVGRFAFSPPKIVYAPAPLPGQLTEEAVAAGWVLEEDGARLHFHKKEVDAIASKILSLSTSDSNERAKLEGRKARLQDKTVTVRPASKEGPLQMDKLGEEQGAVFRKYMAAIDVALQPYKLYTNLRGAYYDETARATWAAVHPITNGGQQAQIWLGYRQSVVNTTQGPMLFVDTAAAPVYAPVSLLAFVAFKLGKRGGADHVTFSDLRRKEVINGLTTMTGSGKPKIGCAHSHRVYKLMGIDDRPADQAMFFDEAVGRERSVAEYFTNKLGIQIRRPDLPCVCCGKPNDIRKILLPIELCKVKGGEPMKQTNSVVSEVLKVAAMAPAERFPKLKQVIEHKGDPQSSEWCSASGFGIKTGDPYMVRGARQLQSMGLTYFDHAARQARTVKVDQSDRGKGGWNLRNPSGGNKDLGFMVPGEPVKKWAAINFAENDRFQTRVLADFVRFFVEKARERGMTLDDRPRILAINPGRNTAEEIEKQIDRDTQLVLCILPKDSDKLYADIKKWSEATSGIVTQCAKADKVQAKVSDIQYVAGILLKLNLKLGGANVHPPDERSLSLMQDTPTMVCGVDVHHPMPGSDEPSWCALVASLDQHATKWHTVVDMQESGGKGNKGRQEVIPKLEQHFEECLKAFVALNNMPPRRVIFYRDGVAHNQFDVIATQEYGSVQAVIAKMQLAGMVEVIWIVAQKKTNARFAMSVASGGVMPMGGGKGGKGKGGFGKGGGKGGGQGELGNVPPGTVIDTEIVDAGQSFDFYLVSQYALKGTAKPTHFHVLKCPDSLTADQIQQFTFDLCHVYARCTKIASRPAPIYYAHLAAKHAPFYAKTGWKDRRNDAWETGSTSSSGSGKSRMSLSDFNQLHEKQRGRLYYC